MILIFTHVGPPKLAGSPHFPAESPPFPATGHDSTLDPRMTTDHALENSSVFNWLSWIIMDYHGWSSFFYHGLSSCLSWMIIIFIMDYHHFYICLLSIIIMFPMFSPFSLPLKVAKSHRHRHPFVASEAPRSCECSPGSWSKPHLNPRKNGHLRVKISLSHDGSMVLLYMVLHGSHQYTPVMLAFFYQHHGSYGYVEPGNTDNSSGFLWWNFNDLTSPSNRISLTYCGWASEILHHRGWLKPHTYWDVYHLSTGDSDFAGPPTV